jgi:hypothetical protein
MCSKNKIEDLAYNLHYPNEFEVPRARIELFKRIPIVTLPQEWNNCGDIRFYSNTTTFKITLYEYLCRKFMSDNGLHGEQLVS